MGEVLKCEDVILQFIKSHPDVTIVVEFDAVRRMYVIGINSTAGGRFRKSKIVIDAFSRDIDREVLESLYHAYNEVAIEGRSVEKVV